VRETWGAEGVGGDPLRNTAIHSGAEDRAGESIDISSYTGVLPGI
jgi:hypothetical protein